MTALLKVDRLCKSFGALKVSNELSLEVQQGEIHAVIGPNGAGKTTLIAQLCGLLKPDSGRIEFEGRNITRLQPYRRALLGLARSYQITSLFLDFSAEENVIAAVQAQAGHSFHFWPSAASERAMKRAAGAALDRVGLSDRAYVSAANLAHGEQRQLEIAMALAQNPKLLLLDEPMAGMGPEESTRMAAVLKEASKTQTLLLIEHDMDVVFALAHRISVLVYGRVIASGTVEDIRNNPDVREAYLGTA